MLKKSVFIFIIFFCPLLALTEAEKLQKTREEIFNSLENESGAELEEIIIEDNQYSTQPLPPIHQTIPPPLPEPNAATIENLNTANEETGHAKNLYLSYLNPINRALYVNEVFPLEFKLVAFGSLQGAIHTEFIGNNGSVHIINPDSPWKLNNDGTFNNTYYAQIKSVDFTVPKLKVSIGTPNGEISEESGGFSHQAILLSGNPLFSGVIAAHFKLDDYKITNYDTQNNLAVFALSSGISNMKDFKIGDYPKQNYESGIISPESSSMIYYVILPKDKETILFDYFSLEDFRFHRISVPNVPIDDRVSTQSDLKPKRSINFSQLAIGAVAVMFLLLVFSFTHSYLSLIGSVLIIAYLITDFFITDNAKLLPNAEVKILPTLNSTVIIRQERALQVEILDKRNDFYKIVTADGRIGWVRKEEVDR